MSGGNPHGFVWFLFGVAPAPFCGPQQRRKCPTMLLDPTIDLCPWKLIVSRKAREAQKQEQRSWIFGGSEWAGHMVGTSPWSHQQRQRQGKDKEIKGKKGNQKVDQKERRRQKQGDLWAVSNCMEFGHWSRDCPICLSTWPRRIQEDKNLFLQAIYSCCEIHNNSAENLSVWWYTFQSFIPTSPTSHICLRCAWFYFMI